MPNPVIPSTSTALSMAGSVEGHAPGSQLTTTKLATMAYPSNDRRIDYVEIVVRDLPRASIFMAVFGWPFTDYGPDYAAFNDGRIDGGLTTEAGEPNRADRW